MILVPCIEYAYSGQEVGLRRTGTTGSGPSGGSRPCSRISTMEGKPDGRRSDALKRGYPRLRHGRARANTHARPTQYTRATRAQSVILTLGGLWNGHMRRREFITLLGGSAAAWPFAALAQQPGLPVVGLIQVGPADVSARFAAAFRKGLNETGYVEDQNVTIEYHWVEGRSDRLSGLVADLVDRRVAVIAVPGSAAAALAAKAATATIPIVFGVTEDPVALGLVGSLSRPGGNLTGIEFFGGEVVAKRLAILRELVPKAVRVAVLVNPADASNTETTLREAKEAAPTMGLQLDVLDAGTSSQIDVAFATLARERPDILFVAANAFFASRRVQLANSAAREGFRRFIPIVITSWPAGS